MFEGKSGAEFVEALAGFELATEEGLHFEFELVFTHARAFELFEGHRGGFAHLIDDAFAAADALGDLVLVPLDAFELCGGLLKRALHDGHLALKGGEAFARLLRLLAEGDFLALHVLKLRGEVFEHVFLLHELEFERLDLATELLHLGLAAQGGVFFVFGGSAVNDAVRADELATHRGDGEVRELALQLQRGVEMVGDDHIVQKMVDEALHAVFDAHLVRGPCDGSAGQKLAIGLGTQIDEILREERGAAHLLIGEALDDLSCQFALGEQNGLQVIFERGLDGGDEGRVCHFDAAGEQTAHAGGIDLRIVEAGEHLLRAGGETFAFL